MRVAELYEYFGNWSVAARELKVSPSNIQYWREKGYIPYNAQLMIERKTKGALKARTEDVLKE